MKESDILQEGDPILRKKSDPVPDKEIGSQKIKQVIADMKSALHDTDDGVAIAAPQIGELVRIFIINGSVFMDRADISGKDKVFINPKIINTSSKSVLLDEGCLSVRNMYGKIKRFTQATVEASDENGDRFQMGASGLLAQIFQHETDHLDGKLFVDEASDIREITPDELSKK